MVIDLKMTMMNMNKFASKLGSQLTKTSSGYKFSITKEEWLSLGKKAGWTKEAYSKIWSQKEMHKIFMPYIKEEGERYEKYSKVIARPANENEKIDTNTSDGKETSNTAKKGDVVITNLTGAKEQYIRPAKELETRYKKIKDNPDGSALYQAIGHTFAIQYEPERHDLPRQILFEAPWKETTVLKEGDMICSTDLKEVYRIAKKEFEETYK